MKHPACGLRRNYLPRTWVNKGIKKGRSVVSRPLMSACCRTPLNGSVRTASGFVVASQHLAQLLRRLLR